MRLLLVIILFSLYACSARQPSGLRCMDGKGLRTKKYKVKKRKFVPTTTIYSANKTERQKTASPTTSSVNPDPDTNDMAKDGVQLTILESAQIEKEPVALPENTVTKFPNTVIRKSPHSGSTIPDFSSDNSGSEEVSENPVVTNTPVTEKEVILANPDWKHAPNKPSADMAPLPIVRTSEIPEPTVSVTLDYNPENELVIHGLVFDKDEDISYLEYVQFVPNFAIFLHPEEVRQQLSELFDVLQKYPNKTVTLYGNGGFDNADELTWRELHYQDIPLADGSTQRVRIYYGSGYRVYEQDMYGLSNEDEYHLQRIHEEGLRERNPDVGVNIGRLLDDRAEAVKAMLVSMGINAKRIKSRKGEFIPEPNHSVKVVIKKD